MDLKEEALLGEQVTQHWYYRAKRAALLRTIADLPPSRVLDIGAGSGFFSRALLQEGCSSAATCIDPGYPADRDESVGGRPLQFRRSLAGGVNDVGLMLMMDVLEHVADDVALAREYVEQLPIGARVVVTVPAFQWLWSGHDVFLEHFRRYTLPQTEGVLQAAGLVIERGSYYYAAILPAAAAVRLGKRLLGDKGEQPKSDMRSFSTLMNSIFWAACRAELPLLRWNRLGGLSVLVRAVKVK